MPLKLKRFSEGIWFDYSDGAKFKIRPIQPKDYLDLREKSKAKVRVDKPDGTFDFIDNYNDASFYWEVFQYILEDWNEVEVEGASGKDQIKEAIFNDRDARDFISSKSNEMFSKVHSDLEGELKNSGGSQSG